jgi:hypothetical protein
VRWANIFIVSSSVFLSILHAKYPSDFFGLGSISVGVLGIGFLIYQLRFQPEKVASDHRLAAKQLLSLRDEYILLIERILTAAIPLTVVRDQLTELQKRVGEVYEAAPDTSPDSYAAASKALKVQDEMTLSADEIDSLLPVSLRGSMPSPP